MNASGAAADCTIGRICGEATEIPTGKRGAGADKGTIDLLVPSNACAALVAEALSTLIERAEISQGGVALDACDISVRDCPVGGDEVLRQAHRPVGSGLRMGWNHAQAVGCNGAATIER